MVFAEDGEVGYYVHGGDVGGEDDDAGGEGDGGGGGGGCGRGGFAEGFDDFFNAAFEGFVFRRWDFRLALGCVFPPPTLFRRDEGGGILMGMAEKKYLYMFVFMNVPFFTPFRTFFPTFSSANGFAKGTSAPRSGFAFTLTVRSPLLASLTATLPGFCASNVFSNCVVISTSATAFATGASFDVGISAPDLFSFSSFSAAFWALRKDLSLREGSLWSFFDDFLITPEVSERFSFFSFLAFFSFLRRASASVGGFSLAIVGFYWGLGGGLGSWGGAWVKLASLLGVRNNLQVPLFCRGFMAVDLPELSHFHPFSRFEAVSRHIA